MITEEAARGLEDRFLSAFETAQHAYEDFVASEAWKPLGYETFTEWWKTKVVPKMRALELRPMKEVAHDVVQKITIDQQSLPKPQRMLQREVAEVTGLTRRRVGQLQAEARSAPGQNFPGSDHESSERGRSATSKIDWSKAEAMARKPNTSFADIAKELGVNESTIRRDLGVRRARKEAQPDFPVNEDYTVRHHENTAFCELEPIGDLFRQLKTMLHRAASGHFYTLAVRDKQRLAAIIVEVVQHDDKLVEMLLAGLSGEKK